jgi:2,4-dichlorophenol 6-monooxygenase
VVRIGTAGLRDAYGEWSRLSGIDEDGCLLVRPDSYIAWRHVSAPPDEDMAAASLAAALGRILDRS